MDKTRALYAAVHGYGLGTEALAAAMVPPLSAVTLRHKVNPNDGKQFPSPEEAIQIQQITGNHGALQVEARELGYVLLKSPAHGLAQRSFEQVNETVREFSEFLHEATSGLTGPVPTGNMMAKIEREGMEAIAAIQDLLLMVRQVHEAAMPATERGVR